MLDVKEGCTDSDETRWCSWQGWRVESVGTCKGYSAGHRKRHSGVVPEMDSGG